VRADLPARIAAGADRLRDFVFLVGRHRDGIDRTVLGANRAASAIIGDAIPDEVVAFVRGATTLKMRFVFVAKIAQGGENRIRRGFTQPAEAALADGVGKPF